MVCVGVVREQRERLARGTKPECNRSKLVCDEQLVCQDKEEWWTPAESTFTRFCWHAPCPAPQNIFLLSRKSFQLSHIVGKTKSHRGACHDLVWLCCPTAGRTAADVAYCSSCLLGRKQEKDKFMFIHSTIKRNNTQITCMSLMSVCVHRKALNMLKGKSHLAHADSNTRALCWKTPS